MLSLKARTLVDITLAKGNAYFDTDTIDFVIHMNFCIQP